MAAELLRSERRIWRALISHTLSLLSLSLSRFSLSRVTNTSIHTHSLSASAPLPLFISSLLFIPFFPLILLPLSGLTMAIKLRLSASDLATQLSRYCFAHSINHLAATDLSAFDREVGGRSIRLDLSPCWPNFNLRGLTLSPLQAQRSLTASRKTTPARLTAPLSSSNRETPSTASPSYVPAQTLPRRDFH